MNPEEYAYKHPSCIGLLSFKNVFAQVIAQHVCSLPDDELLQLEACSWPHGKIADMVCIDEVSVSDMLASPFYQPRASVIAYIDLKPVLYYNGAGIYQWSDTLDKQCLSYWLTHPELPPGWELN
ncbi:hypothetical protein KIF53_08215 [Chromobacterium subtsugae]|uniref:DUF551 domain-containing protein n=1 Tax=Chromobacterium subtsugae TaxID=251747 RepID=A0ABS7FCV0_9NEIS|nr:MULTISPECIES: hypothetical protein [Chromobacterium]KUM01808.1 hypothetical protein Cv017_06405 [Chromobacterium subtsugae]MBW7568576.1 hypothetical protein [Chromobacterium subtsugae]MBW8287611.1 hypothetical protein [Chromobacterium subtsugae]WSE93562.1 hypothetical protein U6115_10100 [Chromobacterium subtsugae]WVH61940.1 hypothetical protein U6151_10120 [Chromobacterium subtsugae]